MTHVNCMLTAKNRDQLRNPILGNRVWATFTFFTVMIYPSSGMSLICQCVAAKYHCTIRIITALNNNAITSYKLPLTQYQWRRQDFVTGGEVRYESIGGLEYEVPQFRLYCLCINVALCSTALQCICRVIRRSSMTMKAHTYYIIFGRPHTGREASSPWRRHCTVQLYTLKQYLHLLLY